MLVHYSSGSRTRWQISGLEYTHFTRTETERDSNGNSHSRTRSFTSTNTFFDVKVDPRLLVM